MKLIQFFKKHRQFSVFLVLARSLVLKIRNRDYAAAATVTGSKTPYMLGDSLRDILDPKTESGEGIKMLEIKDLTVSYQNIPTVQDLSLHMKRGQIVRQMMLLRKEYGTSILVVTHNLGVAAYMSDYMIVMRDGRIEDQGDRDHILHGSRNPYTQTLLDAVPSLGGERFV